MKAREGISLSRLEHVLQEIASSAECRVGLCARVLEGQLVGESVGVREDEVFPSASLIKVLVLAELLRQADSGRLLLEDVVLVEHEDLVGNSEMLAGEWLPAEISYRRLAEGMIRVSDNAATNVLISRLGMGRIDALARELGLHHTALRRKMMDFEARARGGENTTSASDMVALMGEMWGGSLLSPEARSLALELLLGQRLTSGLPIMLPAGACYAHKTGELEGVENDAGLILLPDQTFALAVLVQGDVGHAAALVSSATGAILARWAAL